MRYLTGIIFGLITYFTIRLLLDTVTEMKFWQRSWQLNLVEISLCSITGIIVILGQDFLHKYFDAHWKEEMSSKRILKELGVICLFMLLVQNLLILPIPVAGWNETCGPLSGVTL